MDIVGDELNRCIDFMSDAGGQAAHGFKLLCGGLLAGETAQLGDIEHQPAENLRRGRHFARSRPAHFSTALAAS